MFKKKKKQDQFETASLDEQTLNNETEEDVGGKVYKEETPMEEDFLSEEDVEPPKKPKKTGNGKRIAGVLLMVACIATMFLVEPVQEMVNQGETITVYVAKTDIVKGDKVESNMVDKQDIEKSNSLTSFVYSEDPVGKYAQSDINKDDMFTRGSVGDESPYEQHYLYDINDGKQIISVSMGNFASGLSGYVQAKDIIRLYTYADGGGYTPDELKYVRVLDVTYGSDGATVNTLILEVTGEQAEKLVELEYTTGLHLTLMSRANDVEAERMLKIQETYLESIKNSASQNNVVVENPEEVDE